jgi:hypothetical protein
MAANTPNIFTYQTSKESKTARREHRINLVEKEEEVLWAEIQDGVYQFLLFHTTDILTWIIVLFEILKEYQIRFSAYSNGTIMINVGKKEETKEEVPILERFSNDFYKFKTDVSKKLEFGFSRLAIKNSGVVKSDD